MTKQDMQYNADKQAESTMISRWKKDSEVRGSLMLLWIGFLLSTDRPSPPQRGVSRSKVAVPEGVARGKIRSISWEDKRVKVFPSGKGINEYTL